MNFLDRLFKSKKIAVESQKIPRPSMMDDSKNEDILVDITWEKLAARKHPRLSIEDFSLNAEESQKFLNYEAPDKTVYQLLQPGNQPHTYTIYLFNNKVVKCLITRFSIGVSILGVNVKTDMRFGIKHIYSQFVEHYQENASIKWASFPEGLISFSITNYNTDHFMEVIGQFRDDSPYTLTMLAIGEIGHTTMSPVVFTHGFSNSIDDLEKKLPTK